MNRQLFNALTKLPRQLFAQVDLTLRGPAELESAAEGSVQLRGEAFRLEESRYCAAKERVQDQLRAGGSVLAVDDEDEVEELVEVGLEVLIYFLVLSGLHLF